MPTLEELLSPAHQNPTQKIGFFLAIAFSLLVIFLHFPFNGYKKEHYVTTYYGSENCPKSSTVGQTSTIDEINQYFDALKKCQSRGELRLLPFSKWQSKSAIIDWFSSPIHTIITLVFILAAGGFWLWVFRDKG